MQEVIKEAEELLARCAERGADGRLLGGVAVRLRCPSAVRDELAREYQDLDFVVLRKSASLFAKACADAGFVPEKQFNALHGERRLLFYKGGLALDGFVQVFEQCHRLDFSGRLRAGEPTIQLADLLLTKLQVFEINRKDLTDAVTILLDHEPGVGNPLDLAAIGDVVREDWGWYTTVGDNLQRIPEIARELLGGESAVVESRVERIRAHMESVPKTMAWKLRAKVGRRIPWYQLPEEKER